MEEIKVTKKGLEKELQRELSEIEGRYQRRLEEIRAKYERPKRRLFTATGIVFTAASLESAPDWMNIERFRGAVRVSANIFASLICGTL